MEQKMINLHYEQDQSFRSIYDQGKQTNKKLNEMLGLIHKQKIQTKPKKKNKNPAILKNIVTKKKVDILTKNFINKLQKNSTNRSPIDIQQLECQDDSMFDIFKSKEGIQFGGRLLAIWNLITVIQSIILVFISTLVITFPSVKYNYYVTSIKAIGITIYVMDIGVSFVTKRYQSGRKLIKIWDIGNFYIKDGLLADAFSLMIFPLSQVKNQIISLIVLLICLGKLMNCIKKFQKFQYLFLGSSRQNELYYGLVKVFLTNFLIGHFLSFILNLLPQLNYQKNWQTQMQIENAEWYVKYIWGYYWGTNIMLTVGFGDISAKNHQQALALIFIQTFSCITLAYNISYVGSVIAEIKSSNNIKKTKLKIFNKMSQENNISTELSEKVSSLIEEQFQIQEKFQFDQQDSVLDSLPRQLQSQYRKEANRLLFENIGFLKNMSKRGLLRLAQFINRKIAHPNQTIRKKGQVTQFMLLQQGTLNFSCKKAQSSLNGRIIQSISASQQDKPKILSLQFIKGKYLAYDIKSQSYAILYFLNREDFIEVIRDIDLDFQLFCTIRDKDSYIEGENEVYKCTLCHNQYHNKFNCSRLHYIPIPQNVITNYLNKKKEIISHRKYILRHSNRDINRSLKNYSTANQQYQDYIQDNFHSNYLQEINITKKIEKKKMLLKNFDKNPLKKLKKVVTKDTNLSSQVFIGRIQEMLTKENNVQVQFWNIESDEIKNYKYYIPQFNADAKLQGHKVFKII